MEEWKRIFINKRLLLGLLLLILLNAAITFYDCRKNFEGYEKDFPKLVRIKYEELLQQYRQLETETAYEQIKGYWEEYFLKLQEQELFVEDGSIEEKGEDTGEKAETTGKASEEELYVMNLLDKQITYLHDFSGYPDRVYENAQQMKQVQILGKKGSFSEQNINKTVNDHEKLRKVVPVLDQEQSVGSYIKETHTGYFLLLFTILIVLEFLQERRKGLWQFVYAQPKGRGRLAAVRCCCLFGGVCVTGLLFEAETILIDYGIYGSFGDLSRPVQSNYQFIGCTSLWSMAELMFLAILVKIMTCFVAGLFLWFAVSNMKTAVSAFVCYAVFIAGEYYAYTAFSVQSQLNWFKYINLFAFLDSGNFLTQYHNLNVFGKPAGMADVMAVVLSLVVVSLAAVCIISGKRKPFVSKAGIMQRLCQKVIFMLKPYCHGSIFFHECYKTFIRQKVWLIMAVLVLLMIQKGQWKEVYYDYETMIYNSYMEQIKGPVTDEKIAYLQDEQALWENKILISEEKIARYEEALEVSYDKALEIFASDHEYEREKKLAEQYHKSEIIVGDLLKLSDRLIKLQEQGETAGFVNKIGYQMYLGNKSEKEMEEEAFIMLLFVVVSVSGIQSYEKSQEAEKFLKSTKRGRRKLFQGKCMVMLFVVLLTEFCVTYSGYYRMSHTYHFEELNLSVHSLEEFADFPLAFTIREMMIFVWALRFLILSSVAMLEMFLSAYMRNMVIALFVNTIVFLVPAGLVIAGMDFFSLFFFLRPVTVTWFLNPSRNQMLLNGIVPFIIVISAGAATFIFMNKEK